jgi:hypothetical protein
LLIGYRPPSAFSVAIIAVDSYVCLKRGAYAGSRFDTSKPAYSPERKCRISTLMQKKILNDQKPNMRLASPPVYGCCKREKLASAFAWLFIT